MSLPDGIGARARLHHVSLPVTDLGRARDFYEGVLGLRPAARPDFDFAGAWYDLGGAQLHLIVHPTARALRGSRAPDSRDAHFALRVPSYAAALARLAAAAWPCLEKPRSRTGWRQIFLTDPDGNVIELNAEASD